jgi:hypothetical protein
MCRLQRKTARAPRVLRHGLSAIEVVVVLAIVIVFALCVAVTLPRRRETARMLLCQRNLMQIGIALGLYDQDQGVLPAVPELGATAAVSAEGPLKALLGELGLADLRALADTRGRPPKQANLPQGERRVPGFLCASDPNALAQFFAAPVSYRATTGDLSDGRNGAFAPGRRVSIRQVEAADGASYTAAFAERLVGDNQSQHPALSNYALAPGPLAGARCPPVGITAWRGNAGASWTASTWQSTLYTHALTPGASPSCIAADRRSALMGASSGHPDGVNVLVFDGSVRTFTSAVDAKIWRAWATVPETARGAPEPP